VCSSDLTLFMCFVFISQQTAIVTLHNVNWLVFVIEMKGVYCAVRTFSVKRTV
jgi:hypothetical protein